MWFFGKKPMCQGAIKIGDQVFFRDDCILAEPYFKSVETNKRLEEENDEQRAIIKSLTNITPDIGDYDVSFGEAFLALPSNLDTLKVATKWKRRAKLFRARAKRYKKEVAFLHDIIELAADEPTSDDA